MIAIILTLLVITPMVAGMLYLASLILGMLIHGEKD